MMVKLKIKDKLEDDTLDLSFCDLQDVPIREIATIKKASKLDLSNNQLTSIPNTIVTLTNIIKLDLSKNMLTEIPENIGEMRQLRHLDLYSNQISRLPLSLGDLKNLKWLDLKDNPLTSAVASVAGMCSNSNECQTCARNIISYLSSVKNNIEEERMRRINATTNSNANDNNSTVKKEIKKKKKKKINDRNEGNIDEEIKLNNITNDLNSNDEINQFQSNNNNSNVKSIGVKFCYIFSKILYSLINILILTGIFITLFIILLPRYDKTLSNNVINYLEYQTKLSIKYYQHLGIDKLDIIISNLLIIYDKFKVLLIQHYENIINNF